jgi:hypothetical protein
MNTNSSYLSPQRLLKLQPVVFWQTAASPFFQPLERLHVPVISVFPAFFPVPYARQNSMLL